MSNEDRLDQVCDLDPVIMTDDQLSHSTWEDFMEAHFAYCIREAIDPPYPDGYWLD